MKTFMQSRRRCQFYFIIIDIKTGNDIINFRVNYFEVNKGDAMQEVFIGREKELNDLNTLYRQDKFQLFVLYGRRRVGKTTLLNEFCKGKDAIFYSAEQSNDK